jgi:hypothetical protein
MDGFENAGTLLVRLELHTSELGKSLGGPIAGRGTTSEKSSYHAELSMNGEEARNRGQGC